MTTTNIKTAIKGYISLIFKPLWCRAGWLVVLCVAGLLFAHCTSPEVRSIRRRGQQRLQQKEPLRVRLNTDFYGSYQRAKPDYDGPTCRDELEEESTHECEDRCEEMYGRESDRCEKIEISLINDLYNLFLELRNIQQGTKLNREADMFNFGVMIDIHVESMRQLADHWSEREAMLFLVWLARTNQVAFAIEAHDNDSVILQEVFEKVGEQYRGLNGSDYVVAGINEDLEGFGNTFWTIAQAKQPRNEGAYIIAHRLLDQICNSRDCKLQIYCSRVAYRSTRGSNVGRCPYQARGRLQSGTNSRYCYVHGATVWSFWNDLNSKNDIKDDDFKRDFRMNRKECDTVCGTEGDSPCDRDYS